MFECVCMMQLPGLDRVLGFVMPCIVTSYSALQEIEKKESELFFEKRSVMRGWLKQIFIAQAVITTILGGLMVSAKRLTPTAD